MFKITNLQFSKLIDKSKKSVIPYFFVFFCLICIYIFIQTDLYFSIAITSDEIGFKSLFDKLHQLPFSSILKIENKLGYGSFYWIIGGFLNNLFLLRGLSLLYMLSIPVFIFLIGKKISNESVQVCLAVGLWFSFSAAWWYGKLIGPELLSVFLGMLGVYLTLYKNNFKYIGFILLGLSIGVKLNAVILLVFSLFYSIPFNILKKHKISELFNKNRKHIVFIVLACVSGFILCNPFILIEPFLFIKIVESCRYTIFLYKLFLKYFIISIGCGIQFFPVAYLIYQLA